MNDETDDLYALPPDAIKEPPHTLSKAIRQIGPGLILAASIVGTGELINTTSLGAKAGFSLLWLILLSCVIKVFVQVELGRYAITHGKTTLAAFDSLPGPRAGVSWLCWLWLIMMLTTQAQIAAMEGTVGQAAHMAFPRASQAIAEAAGTLVASWGPYLATPSGAFLGGTHHAGGGLAAALRRLPAAREDHDRAGRRGDAVHRGERADPAVDHVPHHVARSRGTGFELAVPAGRGGPGVLGVRDHGCRGVRAVRLSLLVHREGLRALHRRAQPRTRPGPTGPGAGPA